jgi:hypothetical protein
MSENTVYKNKTKQTTMFGTCEFPSYEEIMEAYAKEFANYILPKGDTILNELWFAITSDMSNPDG